MPGLLPAGMRCSAWWYAMHRGLPQDLGYLKALGLTAYRMARWEGLEEWRVPERHPDGTVFQVCMWPERIWDNASRSLVRVQFWDDANRYGQGFWSYPAPPEDTQAYADWCQMADAESRDEDWGNPYG